MSAATVPRKKRLGPKQKARLIAAAPELLEALRTVWDSTAVLNHLGPEHIDMIEAVIAKATGGDL